MNIDEARAIIDRAWYSAPGRVDWNEVEEASMVIVAETGTTYTPDSSPVRCAIPPSSRGTPDGYDAAVRGPDEPFDSWPPESDDLALRLSEPDDDNEMVDRFLERQRSGQDLSPEWSRRARTLL